jgi:hypothetical protein
MILSFKQFINEVVSNKRQGLIHLRKMKPEDFLDWLKTVKDDADGIIGKSNTKVNLKVDGSSLHFGKSSQGKIFIEGARTGPQFEPGVFSNYAKTKHSSDSTGYVDIILRAKHYDDVLNLFISSSKFKKLRDALPNNSKCWAELFYNPMASLEDDTGISFVTVKYDKKKIGTLMTLVLYGVKDAETGQKHPNEKEIMKNIIGASNNEVKVVSSSLSFTDKGINIQGEINLLDTLFDDLSETKRIVTSRKNIDKEKKMNILSVIDKVKEKLENKILFNPEICGLDRLCNTASGEGLVLHLNTGQSIKVINPEFEIAHHGSKT